MLKRTIRIISLLGSLGGLYGCTLDAPLELGKVQCGDDKDKLAVIIDKEHNICKREDVNKKDACAKYADAFRYNYCPHVPKNNNDKDNDDYICNESEQYGKYCSYKCDFLTQFITGNECINNTEKLCGSSDNNCLNREGWLGAECIDTNFFEASCSATECQDNYKKHDINNGIYECEKVECKDGWHVYNHDCEIDSEENCGSHDKKCTPYEGWSGVECVNGECVPAACGETYELNDEETNCIRLNCDDSRWNDECESNGCYIAENRCYKNNLDNCGGLGVTCAIKGAKTSICDHGTCKVDQNDGCDEYYKLDESETKCIEDSERIPCLDGYHPYIVGECMTVLTSVSQEEQIQALCCEEDTDTNCGEHGLACGENEACVGYIKVEKTIEIDENGACVIEKNEEDEPVLDGDGNEICKEIEIKSYNSKCECVNGYQYIGGECVELEKCDKSGYINTFYRGQAIQAYCIQSKEDLIKMRDGINKNGVYPEDNKLNAYYFTSDIDMGSVEWIPIGNTTNYSFKNGIILGNGHYISGKFMFESIVDENNVAESSENINLGLFGVVKNSFIHDLNIYIDVSAGRVNNANIGTLAGYVERTDINNIHVKGVFDKKNNNYAAGGIVGNSDNSRISNSTYVGDMVLKNRYLGGIVGSANRTTLTGCSVSATLTCDGSCHIGGMIGRSVGTVDDTKIEHCFFAGSLLGRSGYAGGIAGTFDGGIISKCGINDVVIDSEVVGGILGSANASFGKANDEIVVESSYFNGNIKCTSLGGGLAGYVGAKAKISQCAAFGDVIGSGPCSVAGMFGLLNEVRIDVADSMSIVDLEGEEGAFIASVDDMSREGVGDNLINNGAWTECDETCEPGCAFRCDFDQIGEISSWPCAPRSIYDFYIERNDPMYINYDALIQVDNSYLSGIANDVKSFSLDFFHRWSDCPGNLENHGYIYYIYQHGRENIMYDRSVYHIDYTPMFEYDEQKLPVISSSPYNSGIDGKLIQQLNIDYTDNNAPFEERTCKITSGPANGVPRKFKLPIPRSLPALSFCE